MKEFPLLFCKWFFKKKVYRRSARDILLENTLEDIQCWIKDIQQHPRHCFFVLKKCPDDKSKRMFEPPSWVNTENDYNKKDVTGRYGWMTSRNLQVKLLPHVLGYWKLGKYTNSFEIGLGQFMAFLGNYKSHYKSST